MSQSPSASERLTPNDATVAADSLGHFGAAVLAVLVAMAVTLTPGRSDLKDRRVVAYETGQIDWTMPEALRPVPRDAQMFGLLPRLVESLGGQFARSADLAEKDLAEADVVVVLPPGRDWQQTDPTKEVIPQDVRNRLWEYVRGGGTLLVAAEPETHRGAAENVLNELLASTGIQARDDRAVSITENWEHNYVAAANGATVGLDPGQNRFGLEQSVSLRARWPAGPLVAGRWAWSYPVAQGPAQGTAKPEPGQRLGDLVLAAGQHVGKGTVVVLGDASCLANQRLASSYLFTGRLLCSLAGKAGGPLPIWRQLLAILAIAGLVALLAIHRADAWQQGLAAVVLAGAVLGCTMASDATAELLPEGRPKSAVPVAYIDASHLEAFTTATWRPDGLGHLMCILMRNGYLPLLAPDMMPARLDRAALWISIAPARPFTPAEQKTLQGFCENGGIAISMVGAIEAEPSRPMLHDFGMVMPTLPVAPSRVLSEPAPMGAFRQTYGESKPEPYVQFHAAWPIDADSFCENMVMWADAVREYPVVVGRRLGSGMFVLIGDTCFAMNKNLEAEAGEVNENVPFWRWFLARARGEKEPAKPKPEVAKPPATKPDTNSPATKPDTNEPATKPDPAKPAASKPQSLEPAESDLLTSPGPMGADKKEVKP